MQTDYGQDCEQITNEQQTNYEQTKTVQKKTAYNPRTKM